MASLRSLKQVFVIDNNNKISVRHKKSKLFYMNSSLIPLEYLCRSHYFDNSGYILISNSSVKTFRYLDTCFTVEVFGQHSDSDEDLNTQ